MLINLTVYILKAQCDPRFNKIYQGFENQTCMNMVSRVTVNDVISATCKCPYRYSRLSITWTSILLLENLL